MDGISNLIGRPPIPIVLTGPDGSDRTYHLVPRLIGDHAEKEGYILTLRPPLIDVLGDLPASLPKKHVEAITSAVVQQHHRPDYVTSEEEDDFDRSRHGTAYNVWLMFRDTEAEFGRRTTENAPSRHESPDGRRYTLTPQEGVAAALRLLERNYANEHAIELALRQAVEGDKLKNSDRPTEQRKSPPGCNNDATSDSRGPHTCESAANELEPTGSPSQGP